MTLHKNKTINSFIKKTLKSDELKRIDEIERTIDACTHIQRLCNRAYELGKCVRHESALKDEKISEELYDFICLTNEYYPCYDKKVFEKIKRMYEEGKESSNSSNES
jgi:hypothetical protein